MNPTGNTTHRIIFILVAISTFLFIFSNLEFTPWPEMLLWPYLMNHGWLPYRDIAIIHSPLLLVLLSLFTSLVGIGVIQIKIFAWILILLTGLLLLSLKKSYTVLVIWLTLLIRYQGNSLWFESLLTPVIVLLFVLLTAKKYFISGVIFAIALLIKQTAFWFTLPVLLLLIPKRKFKPILTFTSGATLIILIFFSFLVFFQLIGSYYYWSIDFGVLKMPFMSGHTKATLSQYIVSFWPFLVILFIPFVKNRLLLASFAFWAIAGIMGTFPRWELFHFQPGLPFLAVLIFEIGRAIYSQKKTPILLFSSYLFITGLIIIRSLVVTWHDPDRFMEMQVQDVVSYISIHTNKSEKIFVINTWDNIYPLSKRLPSTKPWVPGLPWYMGLPGIQDRLISDLKVDPPSLVVFNDHSLTGLGSYRPDKLEDYIFSSYYKAVSFNSGMWILLPKTNKFR